MSKLINKNQLSAALNGLASAADNRYLKLSDLEDVDDRITVTSGRVYLDKDTVNEIELEVVESVTIATLITQALTELNTDPNNNGNS